MRGSSRGEVRRGVLFSRGRARRATRVAASRRGAAFALFGPPPDPDALLAEGKALYASGERMQGYKTFEKALRVDDVRLETRQELLYCCMCCNAAFGDVEAAKQYLRDMNLAGLPFDVAMVRAPTAIAPGSAPTPRQHITPRSTTHHPSRSATKRIFRSRAPPPPIPIAARRPSDAHGSSAQMRNQLKKFASGEMKSQGTVQREIFERERGAAAGGQKPQRMGDMDLMNLDISGDTSAEVSDIAKRVVGLAVLSIVGFVGLFQVGLSFFDEPS